MKRVLATFACLASALAALCAPTPASAALSWTTCPHSNDYACATLTVPLDPTGATPGSVKLAIRRHRAPLGEARSAIVALAGGPGQSAIPFAEDFTELLGPVAANRDVIVFDQRGTGESGALHCAAFRGVGAATPPPARVTACARQLGPARAFYGTADSVADIEAIRRATGYEKLVLYGTSYGTKVAEEYAQEYPGHVEALVLDSVVPPTGPEVFNRPTFAAIPRILHQICRRNECRNVTPDPVADLARVLRRIRHRALRGRAVGPAGHPHSVRITAARVLGALLEGDFSGTLRALLVSAMRSGALGDYAPLARLLATVPEEGEGETEGIDIPLYYATSCVDERFPWEPAATPRTRLTQSLAAARAFGPAAFAPFDTADAIALSDVPACAYWPPALTTPVPTGPLPAVPTLILSGEDDLRTPTSGAREVAAEIPGSHLLVVPMVGHSVLGEETGDCAAKALQALFASAPIIPCRATAVPARLRPAPPAPRALSAVAPARGYAGLPGRTAHAVQLSVADFARTLELTIETSPDPGALLSSASVAVGGLRAGWARLSVGGATFHGYSFVPGVTVSGTLRQGAADLVIGGSAAAAGVLRLAHGHVLVGTLGGRRVRVSASSDGTAAIVGVDAAARPAHLPGDPLRRAALRRLAAAVGRLVD